MAPSRDHLCMFYTPLTAWLGEIPEWRAQGLRSRAVCFSSGRLRPLGQLWRHRGDCDDRVISDHPARACHRLRRCRRRVAYLRAGLSHWTVGNVDWRLCGYDRGVPRACCRGAAKCRSACPAGLREFRPATGSRAVCRRRAAAGRPRSGPQSFFMCLLGGQILPGVERRTVSLRKRQPGQHLAYATFMIVYGEFRPQTGLKVAAPCERRRPAPGRALPPAP